VCSTGAEGDCRNGNPANGYYKCDYATPTTAGDSCCYDNMDCADDDLIALPAACVKDADCRVAPNPATARCSIDGKCYDGVDNDPSTAELCQQYECLSKAKDGWCDADTDCDKATVCQVGTCDLAKNECKYTANPAKPGCCAANLDCINEEIAAEGQNLAYTIDVCCDSTTNAIGTNTQLDALCAGVTGTPTVSQPLCVHATGQNFCDTAADCTADVGKRCLTAYCVAHRCRFGLPELDGDPATGGAQECCDPNRPLVGGVNPDCEDNDPCTVDACSPVATKTVGFCTHTADVAKPACCNSTEDCTQSTTECVETACQFDATAGYKKCKDFDLKALGLCCSANADCDDANACTLDTCQLTDGSCRHAKPVAECCTKVTECPPTGDVCATKACPLNGATGACSLAAVPNCLASLPYQQDFEFAHDFYNAAFTDEAIVGWTAAGQATDAWAPSSAQVFGQNHSKHLRFAPAGDVAADTGACIALPKLNTTGQSAAVVAFYHALDLAAGQAAVTLTVQARQKASSSWETVWTSTTESDVAENDVYVPVAAKYLGSMETGVRFCVTTGTFNVGGFWTIDDVKVVRGSLPTLVTTITDKAVAKGADLLINDIDAYDQDSDTVSYSLVGAPAFVTLVDFHTGSVASVTHAYVDIQVTDAECEGAGGDNIYPITLKISDGFVNVYEVFNLTVTGCSGF